MKVREFSIVNGQNFHMLDRGERKEKDGLHQSIEAFRSSLHRFANPSFQDWLFGHDVVQEAEEMRESFYCSRMETSS